MVSCFTIGIVLQGFFQYSSVTKRLSQHLPVTTSWSSCCGQRSIPAAGERQLLQAPALPAGPPREPRALV